MEYKAGDIVLVRSTAGPAIPDVHVRLLEKEKNVFNTDLEPWRSELVYEEEVRMLKREWSIPYKYPDQVETYVYEEDIIKKVS